MKGMTAFSRISDVSDYLIEESLELFEGKAAAPAPKPQSAFSRLTNSGWFVAAVCTLVAVFVMGGIIWAGVGSPGGRPDDPVTETYEETELDESSSTEPEDGTNETQSKETHPEEDEYLIDGWFKDTSIIFYPQAYTFFLGEETETITMAVFSENPLFHEAKMSDFAVEIEAEAPSVVEIVSFDKESLLKLSDSLSHPNEGLTVRCLKAGSTRIVMKITYIPTGGTHTVDVPVVVVERPTSETEESDRDPLIGRYYVDGVWPYATGLRMSRYEIEIPLGELYGELHTTRIFREQYDAEYRTGAEYYEAVVVVEDPEIVEVVSVDNYALSSQASRGGVVLRGLKEGTTTVTIKHVYKATGGYEAHEIPVTVVQPTETDTEDETAGSGVDPSEVWEVFFTGTSSVYTVREGETFDGFGVEFCCTWCRRVFHHPNNCPYYGTAIRYEDYSFDLVASNEDVVELLPLDKYSIMNSCQRGGITVVGLREGSTTLALTMTHIPSGKSKTVEATVNVIVDDSPIMPDDHADEAWPGVAYPVLALYRSPITAGKTVQVTFSVYDGEISYNREDYVFEVTAYDPTVIEIVSDGYESYVTEEMVHHITVKGLNAGETWVQMKMIHKATGAASYTYVALSVKE